MTSPVDDLQTIRDLLRYAASRFAASPLYFGHGTDNVWDEAVQLVLRSVHLPLENNNLFLDARLTRSERELIIERIERRITERVPIAYLLGEGWFSAFWTCARVAVVSELATRRCSTRQK